MKKSLLITISVLAIAALISAFIIRRNDAPTKNTVRASSSYLDDLRTAGFTNLPEFVKQEAESKRNYYKQKYGLLFYSNEEAKELLNKNGWLIGTASSYISVIPSSEGKRMIDNLKIVSASEPVLDRYDYKLNEFLTQDEAMERWKAHYEMYDIGVLPLVFIAAPKDNFDLSKEKIQFNKDNTIIPKNPDPIALYKLKDGWLELARW